jgi:hypothetical protein
MPRKKTNRRRVPSVVAAVVQPVARRLSRMESLLIEVRHEQDVKLRRIIELHQRIDALTEEVTIIRTTIRRILRPKK